MSNTIKVSLTKARVLGSDLEVTGTDVDGDKRALDVNVAGGNLSITEAMLYVTDKIRHNHTTPVTTGAYTELLASTAAASTEMEIFDSSGETLVLAVGSLGAEAEPIYIFPGGNGRIPLSLAIGTRISVRAVSANTSLGELIINLYG